MREYRHKEILLGSGRYWAQGQVERGKAPIQSVIDRVTDRLSTAQLVATTLDDFDETRVLRKRSRLALRYRPSRVDRELQGVNKRRNFLQASLDATKAFRSSLTERVE